MAQLAQCLGFNLADALARDGKALPYFLEGMLAAVVQPEAHLDHLLLARRGGFENCFGLFFQIDIDHRFGGRNHAPVLDEVTQVRILFFADGGFERDRFLGNLQHFAHFDHGDFHALGNLFRGRLPPVFLHQLPRGPDELVDRLDHVHGNADGPRLVGDGSSDRLADPPGGVGREFVSPPVLELVHGFHQADIALLDQVQELKAAVGVLLGNGYNQAQVRLDQLVLGGAGLRFAAHDIRVGSLELGCRRLDRLFDLGEARPQIAQLLLQVLVAVVAVALQPLFELADLSFDGADLFHDFADPVDQALALGVGEIDGSDVLRDQNPVPCHSPVVLAKLARTFGARDRIAPGLELCQFLGKPLDFINGINDILQARGHLVFRQFVVIEGDDLLDGALTLLQFFPDFVQFLDHDCRTGQRLQDFELPALDALGDGYLALPSEQGHGSHFAQVHAYRVVCLVERSRRQVQLDVFR